MLILHPKQVCPYISNCPWIRNRFLESSKFPCNGMDPERNHVFTCEFVDDKGCFNEGYGYKRNPYDVTGKMKILVEGKN